MKKLIVTTLAGVSLFALAATSYGQGQVQFQNATASTPITYGAGPNLGARVFAASAFYTYGLYVGTAGSTTLSQLTLIDTVGNTTSTSGSTFAGYINGGTVSGQGNVGAANGFTTGLVGGTTYAIEIAAWPTADGSSYTAALAADPGTGYFGLSGISSTTPTASPSPVDQLFGTGNAFPAGFSIQPIPEPSTIVLGGLGAAALLAFRRRNK